MAINRQAFMKERRGILVFEYREALSELRYRRLGL
jgi:hypothetical protein